MVKYATVATLPSRGSTGGGGGGSGVKLSRTRKESLGGNRRLTSIVHNSAVQLILQNLTGKVRARVDLGGNSRLSFLSRSSFPRLSRFVLALTHVVFVIPTQRSVIAQCSQLQQHEL